ncbi:hypothetical protein AWC02_02730 [Mycolicibacter engbaekii]|uniref:SnoaL-like domain-containing protein n=1 Tax=Mycolicibacter engbaekii TaxID=188915 RepID=A0A1X1U4L6_9MYCO|nr:nuclear transport factor 2 family protein [Mycolicibacter engbaekii]ORV51780.1 hypothetical protein AWC02_02730 [Mycolicibacter engbaekii]
MTLPAAERLALSELVHRYAGYVDARRFDELAQLFTAEAELVLPDPPDRLEPCVHHHGHAGVREAMTGLAGVIRTQHGVVGEFYTGAGTEKPGGDVAFGEITGIAHHWMKRGATFTDYVWYLRYRDTYHRVGPDWRIARRALTIDAIESRPADQVRS